MPLPIPISNADRARQASGLMERGQLKQAERLLKDVLRTEPRQFDALLCLGVLNGMRGDDASAARCLAQAAERNPTSEAALYNLGQALIRLGRHADAVEALSKATALTPSAPHIHEKLGDSLRQLGRLEDAAGHYARAVEIEPGNSLALSSAIEIKRRLCDWANISAMETKLLALARVGKTVEPLLMLHVADDPSLAKTAAEGYWRQLVPSLAPVKLSPRREGRKLRIGYLSGDFRQHPMVSVIAEAIELHDRSQFDVVGLSYGTDDGSPQRKRMEKAFDRFIDLGPMREDRMAQRIAEAGIDILIDLAGYTANARLSVLTARPAPIICHYMGYPGTLGSPVYDYVIADAVVAPPGSDADYSEAVVRLPHCYWAVDTRRERASGLATRSAHNLPEDAVVLASFNGQQKLSPAVFDVWARVLTAVPHSVLWLYADHPAAAANLGHEVDQRGIARERVILAGRVPSSEHLARIPLADLMLDAMPYGGHTTSCDALWLGVPVLTVQGRTFAARVGASLLQNAGLPDLVMTSLEAYEREAIALAQSRQRIDDLKARIAANRATCPLFDTGGFTRSLEQAYKLMWAGKASGPPPATFTVCSPDSTGTP